MTLSLYCPTHKVVERATEELPDGSYLLQCGELRPPTLQPQGSRGPDVDEGRKNFTQYLRYTQRPRP